MQTPHPSSDGLPTLVVPHERIELIDSLRGFALFGIVLVNFNPAVVGLLANLHTFFVSSSFYPTFSFLFGLGFAIQLIRAEERRQAFAWRYAWRAILLFAIGCAHYVFIDPNDILRQYGLTALLLLVIHRARTALLLVLAAAALVFQLSGLTPHWNWRPPTPPQPVAVAGPSTAAADQSRLETQALIAKYQGASQMYRKAAASGDYPSLVRARAFFLFEYVRRMTPDRLLTSVFFMFIMGLVFGRLRVLHDPARHKTMLVRIAAVGLVAAIVGKPFGMFPSGFLATHGIRLAESRWFPQTMRTLGSIGLSFFYIASLSLLFTHRARARRFLALLAPAGRMALTNYLMQSLVLSILLYRPGLHLAAALTGWGGEAVLIAFFALQVVYSRWWFTRFQFGPVEWGWRTLTWGRRMPMLRARVSTPAICRKERGYERDGAAIPREENG